MHTSSRPFPVRLARLSFALVALTATAARGQQLEAAPHLEPNQHFTIDPVVDGVLIVGGAGFAEILGMILSTNEITPSPPGDPANLLSIDRFAVTQTIDPHAG